MGFEDNKLILFSSLLLLFLVYVGSEITPATSNKATLSRKSFPAGFVFGTASSSYQYEGAVREGGRKPSIWDTYTHQYPGRIADGSNGDIADDSYHKYKEDVRIMKEIGMDAYRFSISWSRVLPSGKPSGGVNKEGINYYNRLINELLSKGMQPYVTIFHWDLPQTLEDEYAGFLSSRIVEDFMKYAEICFKEFGDRVKHWITINEPSTFCLGGYANGTLAPGRCSQWQQLNCTGGDSATEPYIVAHNMLLAHATTVQLYKQKFQTSQKGKIGITLLCNWMVPYSDAKHNQNAALRALDFMYGWFMDPLTHGDYPRSMRLLVEERLPKFTKEQSMLVKGSFDFIGLNYYTAYYAAYEHLPNSTRPSYLTDARVNQTTQRNGIPIGPPTASSWLHIYPKGLYDVLLYTKTKYKNPLIYITENGMDDANNASISLKEALADHTRICYYHQHLSNLSRAMQNGVNVNGFFAWSLLDNFQWQAGYTVRFGLNFVDFKNGLKRYPKLSSHWFKTFLKK